MIYSHRQLAVVEFEVDDQTPEDLSIALDRLREDPGVFHVLQTPAFGKKGRMFAHVYIVTTPSALHEVIAACFRETSTIGLRHHLVNATALQRGICEVSTGQGATLRVKTVQRPDGGTTAKAEADDIARCAEGYAERRAMRRDAERRIQDAARDRKAG